MDFLEVLDDFYIRDMEVSTNFLEVLDKIHNGPGKEWRTLTSEQKQRNQAMHVIKEEEFSEYKEWVTKHNTQHSECKCERHLATESLLFRDALPKNVMVRTMCEGYISDCQIAKVRGKDNNVPFGFGLGEQPAFTELDKELKKNK